MTIELLACGFNAHFQLHSGSIGQGREPIDVRVPVTIASAESVRVLFAGWSDTLCAPLLHHTSNLLLGN